MSTLDRPPGTSRHDQPGRLPISWRAVGLVAGPLLAMAVSMPVSAHADLVSSSPVDGAVLGAAPATITLTFSEGLDAGKSSFKVIADGATIGTGMAAVDGSKLMTLDGPVLPPGAYEIRWTAAATDGHIERGTLTFTVAEPTPVPATPAPAPTAAPTPAPGTDTTATPGDSPAAPAASAIAASAIASPAPRTGAPGSEPTSPADVLVPIVAALAVVSGVGALVLRRSRGA